MYIYLYVYIDIDISIICGGPAFDTPSNNNQSKSSYTLRYNKTN